MSGTLTSPLRGIEKLSEDLRLERQKSNIALQEKARLKIEVESLKQTLESRSDETSRLHMKMQAHEHEMEALRKSLLDKEGTLNNEHLRSEEQRREISSLKASIEAMHDDIHRLHNELKEKSNTINQADIFIKTIEGKVISKDNLNEELQNEILQLRSISSGLEGRLALSEETLGERMRQVNDYELRLKQADTTMDNYVKLQINHNELRKEFEDALNASTELASRCSTSASRTDDLMRQVSMHTFMTYILTY
jgi:chromosome segregation ATPase